MATGLVNPLALAAPDAGLPAEPAPAHANGEANWGTRTLEGQLLAVRINEVDQAGEVLAMRISAHDLAVPVSALADWHLRQPKAATVEIDGKPHLPLDAIPGIRWKVEESTQTLLIQVPSAAFLRNQFEVVGQTRPAQSMAPLGGYLDYDLHWERDAGSGGSPGSQVESGLFELGAFSAQGNGRSTTLWRQSGGQRVLTRLDSTWNVDLPARLSSVRIGDAIGTAGAWGRSVRFGGLQWATDFSVQPGLVSFPMPGVKGEATVPSMMDLYVNSQHQLQGNLPPGPFDLPNVPVIAGAGQIRMVVHDLLGREQVIVQPYYVSPSLLRAGLHDFAVEGGVVREDYGIESNHYGRSMLTLTDRTGVTDGFTREFRAELLRTQQTVGASGLWLVHDMATANVSVAGSRSGGQGVGWLGAATLDRQSANWSANIQGRLASRHFVQLGQDVGVATNANQKTTVQNQFSASFSTSVANGGAGVTVLQQSTWQGDRLRTISMNYGRSLGSLGYVSVAASRTSGSSQGVNIAISFIRALGDDGASASAGLYHDRSRSGPSPSFTQSSTQELAQVQSAAPVGPGFGYQLQAERGPYSRTGGDLTWQTERFAATGGVVQATGATSYRGGMSGALALMPEGVFASRRIDGSFAVVKVDDYEGVHVLRDNQVVAKTDDRGLAFVPGLRGFESNHISLDASDLPLDAQVDDLHVAVSPGRGSGVSLRFPVTRTRAASMRLVSADGQFVPAGSSIRVAGAAHDYPVGLDGRVFLAGLGDRTPIEATWEGHACHAEVVIEPSAEQVPELGIVTCR